MKEAEEKAAAEKAAKTFDDTKLPFHAFLVAIVDVQQVLELAEYSAILHPTVFLHVDLQPARLVLKHLMLYPMQIGPASAPHFREVPGKVGVFLAPQTT